jgi:hypothetical protein
MADALLRQERQGRIVVDISPAAIVTQDAAVTVVGVLAKTLVGDEQCLLVGRAHRPQGLLNNAIVAGSAGPGGILVRRDAEKDECLQSEIDVLADFIDQSIDAELVVARHRGDLILDILAGPDEERQDQVPGRQVRLTDQLADDRVMTQTA